MLIAELVVTQEVLRNPQQLPEMVSFVISGGFWNKASLKDAGKLIYISQFPDNKLAIHDGHHRAVSIHLGGRTYLREDEYELAPWSYESYINIVPEFNWVTPFDPRTEVRTADFGDFRTKALDLLKRYPDKAEEFIFSQKKTFSHPRNIVSVGELAQKYRFING